MRTLFKSFPNCKCNSSFCNNSHKKIDIFYTKYISLNRVFFFKWKEPINFNPWRKFYIYELVEEQIVYIYNGNTYSRSPLIIFHLYNMNLGLNGFN